MAASANRPGPLEPYNLFEADPVLADAVKREGAEADVGDLGSFGERVGSAEVFEWGRLANTRLPELITHDPSGTRIDEVRYDEAYHSLMELSLREGVHSLHYERQPGDGGYVARTAMMFLIGQVEMGHCCPISMTGAVLPALRNQPDLAGEWEPRILSREYDPRLIPPAEKSGCLIGMGMTERQGGSDLRANTSTAVRVNGTGSGGEYRVTGHKWFTSAPMCDAFMILANAPAGLSCFLVPRVLADGSRNALQLMRLKDKLGNRSNASSELEFVDAAGWLVGEEGRGIRTIIDMVSGTRIDCATWAVSLMRQAVSRAGWHVAHRSAFGGLLMDKPLMQNVMADLEIETEAATLMLVRVSGAYERAPIDSDEAAFARLAAAIAKYWLTKRSSPVVREALECIGGDGYVEDSILPRLYREAPLNAIWEGAGNVIALDVLRALDRSPHSVDAFIAELDRARGSDPIVDRETARLKESIATVEGESGARRLVEQMATCWAAALLTQYGEPSVAEAYIRSRLDGAWGSELGTLSPAPELADIARRAVPRTKHGASEIRPL
jgi:putative acyl-CoA dehydrogenase